MKQYLELLEEALNGEVQKDERTGNGTVGVFKSSKMWDLQEGFPAVTTKRLYWNGVLHEAIWFLQGDDNIEYLVENNVNIWNSDAMRHNMPYILDSGLFSKKDLDLARKDADRGDYRAAKNLEKLFINEIKTNKEFAKEAGSLGPVYGPQWTGRNGAYAADQIHALEEKLRAGGTSRRMVVNAWNSKQVPDMALPPCHVMWQVHVSPETNKLSLGWTQRSCDTVLGVPFNIASYGLITEMLAHTHGFEKGNLAGDFYNLHVYLPHIDAAKEQLQREPGTLPQLKFNTKKESITDYRAEDIELVGYNPQPKLENPTPMFGGFF